MRKDDHDSDNLALQMPVDPPNQFNLTESERENILARARVELFKLTFEVSGEEHAQLETEVNQWINADRARVEMFWREPERTVRQALKSQLRDALSARGLDMASLEGN